jgi:hypothetical protein
MSTIPAQAAIRSDRHEKIQLATILDTAFRFKEQEFYTGRLA